MDYFSLIGYAVLKGILKPIAHSRRHRYPVHVWVSRSTRVAYKEVDEEDPEYENWFFAKKSHNGIVRLVVEE